MAAPPCAAAVRDGMRGAPSTPSQPGLRTSAPARDPLARLLQERTEANRRFFEAESERIARLCHRMAERFARGGRLLALGISPAARSDVRHVTVEFVHPVIVGKRALPAIGLSREGGSLAGQVELLADPRDVAIAFGLEDEGGREVGKALGSVRRLGCLTIAFEPVSPAEWGFAAPGDDPFVRQELVETTYHVLWELVHVFFEHRGLLEGRETPAPPDPGAAGFLYPFLTESQRDLEAVTEDVRRSVLMKSEEVGGLRDQTLTEGRDALLGAARAVRRGFEDGGRLLALGNGGSATDAMDAVADFRFPPAANGEARWPARPAIDLTEDSAVITAIGNDIGIEAIFQRQVIAHGRRGDSLLALSTSGDSENVIGALVEARRRGMVTVAMVGYDGGRVAADGLADHVIVTRSQHIPRIQEAQASAYHALRELVELVEPSG
jgi:D-sedoheptulose 7-phosphate isomerase